MHALELKIPPPVVTTLIAAAMWGISLATPSLEFDGGVRMFVAVAVAVAGICISIAGVFSFRQVRTTVNPMKPETTSSLVTAGVYRYSRNPMYVGILFTLIAWAVFLFNVGALIGPVAFVFYINRFQIAPEERALAALFGTPYADYQSAVRRWL